MSNPIIKPTIGRIVCYRGGDGEKRAAVVTRVHDSRCLNLYVFGLDGLDAAGGMKEDVTHADPWVEPESLPSWNWMPYQIREAMKSDDARGQASADRKADEQRWRAQALDMALRTPGVNQHSVLKLAAALHAYIESGPAVPKPADETPNS